MKPTHIFIDEMSEEKFTEMFTGMLTGEAAQDLITGRVTPDGEWSESFINDDMTEGDLWRAARERSRIKKQSNAEWSMNFLKEKGVNFTVVNPENWHLRIGDFNFYPTTGLFFNMRTKKKGRGVKNLFNIISK